MIFFEELAPMRVAPAAIMASAASLLGQIRCLHFLGSA